MWLACWLATRPAVWQTSDMTRQGRRLVRDRRITLRVASRELRRWHVAAGLAGLSLAELIREGTRTHMRRLRRDTRVTADMERTASGARR
jgi:hypothetical protein